MLACNLHDSMHSYSQTIYTLTVEWIDSYIVCCLLPHKFLPQALHCYCMLLAGLRQIIRFKYVATWSLPMSASAVYGILCNAWYIVYCHIIYYCEYWSDTILATCPTEVEGRGWWGTMNWWVKAMSTLKTTTWHLLVPFSAPHITQSS